MTEAWVYIARTTEPTPRCPTPGTAVCATVDEGRKDTGDTILAWLRDGLTIERVPVEWARKHLFTAEPYVPIAASTPSHAVTPDNPRGDAGETAEGGERG